MSRPVFPLRAVAALYLERQHLGRPRAARLTAARLRRLAEDTGGLQIDTINVVDRAHYLTVWSRFGNYDRRTLDRLIYRRRVLFEYWSHAACLVPDTHFPAWRRAMLDYRVRHTGWRDFLRRNRKIMRGVEDAIRERGPLANADFQQARPGGAGWWSWKPATHALHHLWMTGRTLVHSRVHFQKRYDLAERVMPAALAEPPLSSDAFARWHLERSLHAMGAATETDLRMYLAFPRTEAAERRARLERLLRASEAVEVGIAGDRARWYALARDLPALERAARARAPSRGTTLLSPFDSFLWHRARTQRLFGFDYTLEVYTPGHKRVHGYYALPILHDGHLIGRLDAKNHRAEQRLEVKSVHFERWFERGEAPSAAVWGSVDRDAALAGLGDALRSLAAFLGAERVSLGRVAPARLKPALARTLRAAENRAPVSRPAAPGPVPADSEPAL